MTAQTVNESLNVKVPIIDISALVAFFQKDPMHNPDYYINIANNRDFSAHVMSESSYENMSASLPCEVMEVVRKISNACEQWGFFQVTHHGMSQDLRDRFEEQQKLFFDLSSIEKNKLRRGPANARGYFDNELTKRRRDWKEALDIGRPMQSGEDDGVNLSVKARQRWNIPDDDLSVASLEGYNRFPSSDLLPKFRSVIAEYFEACAQLAHILTKAFLLGLGENVDPSMLDVDYEQRHSSYLRLNHYPPCPELDASSTHPNHLGISPHTDAGFLTILHLHEDEVHSLQMRMRKDETVQGEVDEESDWLCIVPYPNAFTINTGDMARVISNGRYHAPVHRVLANPSKRRFSAPFFYNPSLHAVVNPVLTVAHPTPQFHPVMWGYFRAQRFAGDTSDFGTEIQVSDFLLNRDTSSSSWHVKNQLLFSETVDYNKPFDTLKHKNLLVQPQG